MLPRKIAIAVAVSAAIGASGFAQASEVATYSAVSSTKGNFTMLTANGSGATGANPNYDPYATVNDPNSDPFTRGGAGYAFGGTNNVAFTWTGTLFNASGDYTGPGGASNATISSPTLFFGAGWVAHTVQIFGPGTYSFDSSTGGGNGESGLVTMTVGSGQLGAHMLFNWGGNDNIDVVNVYNIGTTFASCGSSVTDAYASNCMWTGAANPTPANTTSTVWMLASTDDNADGTLGVPMAAGGPFGGFNANFNLKGTLTELPPAVIPVPAAVWLFGSGLLGLVGIARRKKKA
jgi:hypothetical protein